MRSLRARLLFRATAVLVVSFLLAGASQYFLIRWSLMGELDAALLLEARSLAAHVEYTSEGLHVEPEILELPEYSRQPFSHFYELCSADGTQKLRSPSLGENELPAPAIPPRDSKYQTVKLFGQSRCRVVTIGFEPRIDDEFDHAKLATAPPRATLSVARETAGLDSTLAHLGSLLLLVTVLATVACVVLVQEVVRR
jgi:hypothetical protein